VKKWFRPAISVSGDGKTADATLANGLLSLTPPVLPQYITLKNHCFAGTFPSTHCSGVSAASLSSVIFVQRLPGTPLATEIHSSATRWRKSGNGHFSPSASRSAKKTKDWTKSGERHPG